VRARGCLRGRSLLRGVAGSDLERAGDCIGARALLCHVGELVREQSAPGVGLGGVLAAAEDDLVSDRVGERSHDARRRSRARVRVNSHRREVEPDPRLEEGARRRGERAARRA
jgi:hypothetical protein